MGLGAVERPGLSVPRPMSRGGAASPVAARHPGSPSRRRLMVRAAVLLLLAILSACCPPAIASAQSATTGAIDEATALARFESAWNLVDQRYWDLSGVAVDWAEVGERYRLRLRDVTTAEELYELLEAMYDELGDDHSVFVPPARVAEIRETYGDLPCVAVFGSAADAWRRALTSRPALPSPLGALLASNHDFPTEQRGNVEYGITTAGSFAVGYLQVPDLVTGGTAEAVRHAVTALERRGARALVLDLRGNPGGRLVTMMQVAGVFTRGFLWRTVTSWTLPIPYPAIGAVATELPLFVLIDGDVHSAAEGLAGALQANGRATIVGERSAGNVEAVLPFCLRDGSQAWIATGVLAPLLGPTWEGRGVVPDIDAGSEAALEHALAELSQTLGER